MSRFSMWQGWELVQLKPEQVVPDPNGGKFYQHDTVVGLMNKAFKVWYDARRQANELNRVEAQKSLDRLGKSMSFLDIVAIGTPKNLYDAFEHIDKNTARPKNGLLWTDKSYSMFCYGDSLLFRTTYTIPTAIANFANAFEANLRKLSKLIINQSQELEKVQSSVHVRNKAVSVNWDQIAAPFRKFDEYTKAIDPLFVLLPEIKAYEWAKASKEYVLAASDILDILDHKNTDFERGCKALAFVLAKCVPIFGETYSEAVKTIPYIVTALTTFTAQWNRELVEWGLEPIYLQNPFSKK